MTNTCLRQKGQGRNAISMPKVLRFISSKSSLKQSIKTQATNVNDGIDDVDWRPHFIECNFRTKVKSATLKLCDCVYSQDIIGFDFIEIETNDHHAYNGQANRDSRSIPTYTKRSYLYVCV